MNNDCDIIIAGGGLAGATAALSLALNPQLNLQVTLIDPAPIPHQPKFDRPIAINHASVTTLKQLQLWDKLQPHAFPIKHIHVSQRGHFGKTRLHADDYKVDALGYNISLAKLTQTIQQTIIDDSNTQIIQGTIKEIDTTSSSHSACVTLASTTEQPETELNTKLIIAADGTQSPIRQQLNIDITHRDFDEVAIIATIDLDKDHQGTAYERFTDHGTIAMLPLSNKKVEMIWVSSTEQAQQLLTLNDHDFSCKLQHLFGNFLGSLDKISQRLSYPLKSTIAATNHQPHVVLLGNAAHTLHPIAAQGFNLALRNASLLIQSIEQGVHDQKDLGDASILQHYHQHQHASQQKTINMTNTIHDIFHAKFPLLKCTRSLGLIAFDCCPNLQKLLVKTAGV